MASISRSRSRTVSGDHRQFSKLNSLSPPPVIPEALFIATSAACQIITTFQEHAEPAFDTGGGKVESLESASITPSSLCLLNEFLDHLLFNVLAEAKSTQLSALRSAIMVVLKSRFGNEVVSIANDELKEYMGSGDNEELLEFRGGQEPRGEFDLIRSWKLTRLRCMVYTRLGDMEEEDEDEYIERDSLDEIGAAHRRFASHIGNITPAAAIFLTSIIENLGEKALGIAAEAARSRSYAARASNALNDGGPGTKSMSRLVVEDIDMEKVALNSTLGRYWRAWRKCVRGPTLSRTLSRESLLRRPQMMASSRKSSVATFDEGLIVDVSLQPTAHGLQQRVDPALVALPMTENDVNEIEAPAPVQDLDSDVETRRAIIARKVRPRSLILTAPGSLTSISSNDSHGAPHSAVDSVFIRHIRTKSLPAPASRFRKSPSGDDRQRLEEPAISSELQPSLRTMYEENELEASFVMPSAKGSSRTPQLRERSESEARTASIVPSGAEEKLQRQANFRGAVTEKVENIIAYQLEDYHHSGKVEVIEGQGTYERPKIPSLSAQRLLKRKTSKDTAPKRRESIPPLATDIFTQQHIGKQIAAGEFVAVSNAVAPPAQPSHDCSDHEGSSDSLRSQNHDTSSVASREPQPQIPQFMSAQASEVVPMEGIQRGSSNATGCSSHYSDSAGALASNSDDSDFSRSSRTPPQTKSQGISGGSQFRYGQLVSPGEERAAVQRVTTPLESPFLKSRRSGSISSAREKRPVTSGSAASSVSHKLKGLIGRHYGETDSVPPIRLRSSSDVSRRSSKCETDDDKSGLDKLIRSNETIRYTLTPRNMREMEAPGSPRWNTSLTEPNPVGLSESKVSPESGQQQTETFPTDSIPVNGLRAHPLTEKSTLKSDPSYIQNVVSIRSPKPKVFQARDARPKVESTREFADFIRSTGPLSNSQALEEPKLSHQQHSAASGSITSEKSESLSISSHRMDIKASKLDKQRKTGPRLEARPAVINRGGQTSELIDFIREGPPTAGVHRIPRIVAPFRSTMDSDELQSLDARLDKDLVSNDGSTQAGSLQSFHSHTRLLDSRNSAASKNIAKVEVAAAGAAPASMTLKAFGADDDGLYFPKKRRGARDPYAIDSDDEDFADIAELSSSKSRVEEESFMDFLRCVPPPAGNDAPPQPFSMNIASSQQPSRSTSVASSIKSRLKHDLSLDKSPVHKSSISSLRSRKSNQAGSPISPSPISALIPSNWPTQNSISETGTAGRSDYSTHVNRERHAFVPRTIPGNNRVLHKNRETTVSVDLLNQPPESPAPSFLSGSSNKDFHGGSFSRFFMRRKKVEA